MNIVTMMGATYNKPSVQIYFEILKCLQLQSSDDVTADPDQGLCPWTVLEAVPHLLATARSLAPNPGYAVQSAKRKDGVARNNRWRTITCAQRMYAVTGK